MFLDLRVPRLADRLQGPCVAAVLIAAAGLLVPTGAFAQNQVGGHFGLVLPLVTHVDGETTDIADDFLIGFPAGVTVKTSERVAFDLELVPVVQDEPLSVDLTVHPGVLVSFGSAYTAGLRAAFDVSGDAWGVTPLVARGFPIGDGSAVYFVELDVPIRVQDDATGSSDVSVGIAFHTGIGF